MEKKFDLISMGEAVVEIFRKEMDVGFDAAADFIGPFPSGAPAITADTMARLGGRSAFIAAVGDDDFGAFVVKRLNHDGVDTSNIFKIKNVMTGLAFTSYFSNGNRKFIYNFTTAATAYLTPEHIDPRIIKSARWLHVSGNVLAFSQSTREAVIKAAEIAYKSGAGISLDPNVRMEIMEKDKIRQLMKPVLDKTTVLLPSRGELNLIFGEDREERKIIQELLGTSIKVIVRKEGEAGCSVFTAGNEVHADAFTDIEAIDPTGCGDSFCAGFIYGLLRGWEHKQTALFANAVGALTTTKKGAMEGAANLEEVIKFLKDRNIAGDWNENSSERD